ncbi:MAG: hypothetical protein J6C87_05715 [Bacteroides sp.]|nr:hypothetical protein [Bacteroides sp.]
MSFFANFWLLEKNTTTIPEDELRHLTTELALLKARMDAVKNLTESVSLKLQGNERRTKEWAKKVERLMEKKKQN